MRIFRIYDTKAEQYGPLVAAHTNAEAVRQLEVIANDPGTEIGRHPEDFLLFHVGNYSGEVAAITASEPRHIATAIDLVKETK